jgi:flagellar protein FliT
MIPTQQRFLDCYEAIAVATRRMLEAAREGDWQAFATREHECRTWMEHIERLGDPDAVLDATGRRRRLALLQDCLRDDAALRELLQPWLGRLDRFLRVPAAGTPA